MLPSVAWWQGVVIVQYLDDILLVGGDKGALVAVAEAAVQALFLMSEKSKCEP